MQRAERRTGFNVCTVDAVILIIHSVVLIIHCNVAHSVPRLSAHAKRPATIMQPWGSTGALVCGRSGATPDSKRGAVRELHLLSAAPLRRAPCSRSSPAASAGQMRRNWGAENRPPAMEPETSTRAHWRGWIAGGTIACAIRIAAAGSSPGGGERSQPSGRGTGGAVRAPTFSDRTSILLHSNPGGWPWRLGRGQIEGWQPEVTGHRRTQRRLQLHRSPRCQSVKQGWIRQRPCPHTHTCNTSARSGRQPTAVAVSSAHPVARFV